MKLGTFAGWHIALLVFGTTLLSVPLSKQVFKSLQFSSEAQELGGRFMPFLIGYLVFLCVPSLRRWAVKQLAIGIPRQRRLDVAVVSLSKATVYGMAIAGAIVLWHWMIGGSLAVSERLALQLSPESAMKEALGPFGALRHLIFFSLLGPLLEELVFRGLLYPAWERRWGWFPAMILTSIFFGLYHPAFLSAFLGSIVLVCLFRRTGSLWAPIAAHSISNLALWYPLMGQLIFTPIPGDPDSLAAWTPHLLSLLVVAIAIPVYVFMARNAYPLEGPGDALPK